jgi:hypothetical protein
MGFGCMGKIPKKSYASHPLIDDDNTDKYDFGEVKNYRTEFLVLLNEEDLRDKSQFWFGASIKSKLLKKQHKFPGKLNIIGFDDIEKEKEFIIEDNPLPNEIYMKLPNKNLYVLSSKYNLEYFYSKQNELKNIFILLGAKTITMKIIKKNNINNLLSAEIGVNFPNIAASESISLENGNSSDNQETTEMTFDYDENIMNNINPEMFSNKNFYFLPKEYNWQDIIIRRLEKKLITDKHTFVYTSNLSFKSAFSTKLKMINVNFNYNTEDFENIQIAYEIEYYKLPNSDEKIDEIEKNAD